jgi:hypothetical protein
MSSVDFAYNITTNNNSDRWSCILDLDKLRIYFYYNGSLLNSFAVPAGQSWLACYSGFFSANTNNQSLFAFTNRASWTYVNIIGYTPEGYSPGGVVSGYAADVYNDLLQIPSNLGTTTLHDPSLEILAGYAALPAYLTGGDTLWGALDLWTAETANVVYCNPKVAQDAANLIENALDVHSMDDFWGQSPIVENCAETANPAPHAYGETLAFITGSAVRTTPAVTDFDFDGGFEQVAGVNTAAHFIPWNYNYETTLYPLNPQVYSGLSNTTNNSVVV